MRTPLLFLLLVVVPSICGLACVGGHITIKYDDDQGSAQTAARAAALAASLVGQLRELEGSLARWEICLDTGTCASKEFLDSTESALLGILADPQLAPLRDWVREGFQAARLEVRAGGAGTQGRYHPVALRHAAVQAETGSSFRLMTLVRRIIGQPRVMAENRALLANLCVTSLPAEANFRMWPSSDPQQVRDTRTTGRLTNVYRGLFAFELRTRSRTYACPEQQCAKLNLVDDPSPIFNCSLNTPTPGCRRQQTPVAGCGERPDATLVD